MISGLTLTGSAGSCTLTVTSGVLAPGAGGAGPWCGEGAGQGPGGQGAGAWSHWWGVFTLGQNVPPLCAGHGRGLQGAELAATVAAGSSSRAHISWAIVRGHALYRGGVGY